MVKSYYFYDTETSGINPRSQRIMQFAGVRTDLEFNPIGMPHNILIKLTEEIIPDPEAITVHGILPQKTLEEGLTEAEFIKIFNKEVLKEDTIIVGFNNIRFDDEFIRHLMWRNFYDPYEWHWKDGKSRWDLLDVSRIIRALRPEGINWPLDENGKPTNRLELLAKENNLLHEDAHDALSDVYATIELAKLLNKAQPKIFSWLAKNRGKKDLVQFINLTDPKPFIYSSGRYSSDFLKTSVVFPVAPVEGKSDSYLVYDLRVNPKQFIDLNFTELKKRVSFFADRDSDLQKLPVKEIALNRCPAIAPIEALDDEVQSRIGISKEQISTNIEALQANKTFGDSLRTLWAEKTWPEQIHDVDFQLYDSLLDDSDKDKFALIHENEPDNLIKMQPEFNDERLDRMFIKFKARNFPQTLSLKEQTAWQSYKNQRIENGVPGQATKEKFFERLEKVKDRLGEAKTEDLATYVDNLSTDQPTLI